MAGERIPEIYNDLKTEEERRDYINQVKVELSFQCDVNKNAKSCHGLAEVIAASEQDYKKAGEMYRQNCDEKDFGPSCFNYAAYVFKKRVADHGEDKLEEYLTKACDGEHAYSCTDLARHLTKKDPTKSLELFKRGCDLRDKKSCYFLQRLYTSGDFGLPVNPELAAEFKKKGQDLEGSPIPPKFFRDYFDKT